jgi:hypothetical protein
MSKNPNSKGGPRGKGKNVNWFKQQDEKRIAAGGGPKPSKKNAAPGKTAQPAKSAPDFRKVDDAPILTVQMNSKNEERHFEEAFTFAQMVSDPSSDAIMTIHLNMNDELVFNMKQDETFDQLWKQKKLMLLVAFPKNWKTMTIDAFDDEDDEPIELETDMDRFDYLYEAGMSMYEGK